MDLRDLWPVLLVILTVLVPFTAPLIKYLIKYLVTVWRLKALHLPTLPGYYFLGYTFHACNFFRRPTTRYFGSHILNLFDATCNLFPKDGLIQIDLGYFMPAVALYKADTAEKILKHPKEVSKTREYFFLHKFLGDGLATSAPELWKKHRKMLNPAFHHKLVDTFQSSVSTKSQVLVDKLKPYLNREIDNIEAFICNCTLDIICGTNLGYEIGDYDNTLHPLIESIDCVTSSMMERVAIPWYWTDFTFSLTDFGKRFNHQMQVFIDYCTKMVHSTSYIPTADEPKEEGLESRCLPFVRLLQKFFESGAMSDSQVNDHAKIMAIAGSETSSATMIWTTYFLGLYPEVQEKAFEEINRIFNGDRKRPVTNEDLAKMTYLDCVIKESLRLIPIIPFIGRLLQEDLEIGGHLIPKGTSCFVMIWTLHRDPEIFPNPEVFNPERFLNAEIPKYAYIPFSAGPRGCIGYTTAMHEMKTIIAHLLRNFKWTSLDAFDVVYPSWGHLAVRPAAPVKIRLEDRSDLTN